MTLDELQEIRQLFRQAIRTNSTLEKDKIEAVVQRGVYKKHEYALKAANAEMSKWREQVQALLSTKIPSRFLNRRRPHTRRYPYMNTGTLKNSVKTRVRRSGKYGITLRAEISAPYAEKLNAGLRRRKDGKEPKWKGWVDRVLRNGDKTVGLKSVTDIFNEIKARLGK